MTKFDHEKRKHALPAGLPDNLHDLLTYLSKTFGKAIYSPDQYFPMPWESAFLLIGRMIIDEIGNPTRSWARVNVFVDLLLEKHKLYGAAPLLRWGPVGVIIRIDSKYARIMNMRKQEYNPAIGESIEDTQWDILGYCILGYRLTKLKEKR